MKKIVSIYVMTLLIIITSLSGASLNNNEENINKFNIMRESKEQGWTYLQSFPNYAPNGLPDYSQKQHNWKYIIDGGNGIAESIAVGDDVQITPFGNPVEDPDGTIIALGPNCYLESIPGGDDVELWNFCLLTSIANCFWWLDSKYDDPDGTPGDGEDQFPLVEDYGIGDDHIAGNAPLLICKLANWLGITTYNITFPSIDVAVDEWFNDKGLGNAFDATLYVYPTFEFIATEIEQEKPVILQVLFFNDIGGGCVFQGNHFVSCAGVNSDEMMIAICDPFFDINNPDGGDHNDAQNVSYDTYDVAIGSPCSNYPNINFWLPDYWPYYDYCLIDGAGTINVTNEPPDTPSIIGNNNGKVGKEYVYTFNSIDSDGDDVKYYIDWGDGTTEWTGFNASGSDVEVKHTWSEEGIYTIRAKAKDTNFFIGPEDTLEVTIPRNRLLLNTLFLRLFERFSNAFPLLRQLLNL